MSHISYIGKTKMIDLDYGGEEFVFENDWDTAVPVTVRKRDGEDVYIEVFPTYEREAREFEKLFACDPFSRDALSFLWERIGVPMEARGYCDEKKFRHRWYHTLVIKRGDEIDKSVILPSTVKLTESAIKGKRNRTTFDLERYIEEEINAFVTIEGGEVLSIAAENMSCSGDFDDDEECGGITEIGVETAVGVRGRGFAASNAAALARHLIETDGVYVTYETDCDNASSLAVARRAGFVGYGKCYYYVMRKKV